MKQYTLLLVLLASLRSTSAQAAGANAVELGLRERKALSREITLAKTASPQAFEQLSAVRMQAPALYTLKRGRTAVMVPRLVALGPSALLPMLEALAISSDAHKDMSDEAYATWRASLVEAVGRLRDARSLPYLLALLQHAPASDATVLGAAGRALGQLRSEEAVAALMDASSSPERTRAALIGLGEARRISATKRLAVMLRSEKNDSQLMGTALKALGNAGSSWAWETLGGATTGEGEEVRKMAALELVHAWARLSSESRDEAFVALSMTEHRDIPAMVQTLKAEKGADVAALDALLVRVKQLKLR